MLRTDVNNTNYTSAKSRNNLYVYLYVQYIIFIYNRIFFDMTFLSSKDLCIYFFITDTQGLNC